MQRDTKPVVVIAVQARMGSTRLPGKTLIDLAGRPMLARLVERMRRARTADRVVIAATTAREDALLEDFARTERVDLYRGSVDDIASRLLGAADTFGADIVARVWGDSPLMDPAIVDSAVSRLEQESLDHVCTFFPRRTYPAGFDVDVYRASALRRLIEQTTDPFFREFPFEFVHRTPGFRHATLEHTPDLSALELTVDYEADLELVRTFFETLGPDAAFTLSDIAALLDADQSLGAGREQLERNPEYRRLLLARAGERRVPSGQDPATPTGQR
jgi:spore coat polysaccharide biosynthesis protein SpsF (cytidylyltransferase family)